MTDTSSQADMPDGFSHLAVHGHRLRVYTRNIDRPGTPLLICNGLGQAVEMLFPLMDQLPDCPIVAFDTAGVGRSDDPRAELTIADHARFALSILDGLGLDNFDVLGISWGGSIAQELARREPDRCRRLVLAITSTGGLATWWGSPVAMFEILFPLRYFNHDYGNLVGPWMYGGDAILQPSLFAEYSKNAIRPTYRGYAAQVRAMCNWTSLGWVHRLRQPTLVLSGLFDGLIPAGNQLALAALIPDARLVSYPAGHLLMYSRRHTVAREIDRFLG